MTNRDRIDHARTDAVSTGALRTRPLAAGLLACSLVVAALSGCGGEEEVATAPPPPPAPPKNVEPPKPPYTPLSELMRDFDSRLVWDEENAPKDDDVRIAILSFFDAQARGDETTFGDMLPLTDARELEKLVDSGRWEVTTGQIDRIEIEAGEDPTGSPVVMAIIETFNERDELVFQPQMWHYTVTPSESLFEAEASPPNIIEKLYGADRIARWFEILAEEWELANKPDEELEAFQRDLTGDEDDEASAPAAQPTGPMAPNRRRPPSGPTRPAPRGPFSR